VIEILEFSRIMDRNETVLFATDADSKSLVLTKENLSDIKESNTGLMMLGGVFWIKCLSALPVPHAF
jgi:hypothetical protein